MEGARTLLLGCPTPSLKGMFLEFLPKFHPIRVALEFKSMLLEFLPKFYPIHVALEFKSSGWLKVL